MLVLTRKLMEKLYIGEDICVTVVRVEGGQVRLGIDAPRDVAVLRAELIEGPADLACPAAPLAHAHSSSGAARAAAPRPAAEPDRMAVRRRGRFH